MRTYRTVVVHCLGELLGVEGAYPVFVHAGFPLGGEVGDSSDCGGGGDDGYSDGGGFLLVNVHG